MLSWLKRGKGANPSSAAQQPFVSQGDMLHALNKDDENGLCGPLTNMVAEEHLRGAKKTTLFSQSNETVYYKAVEVESHQEDIRKIDRSNGKHSAFIDTETPFQVDQIPAANLNSLTLNDLGEHNLITFPVEGEAKGSDPYHQIYFKRQQKDCVKFDAEQRHGEKKGNCQELFDAFKKSVSTGSDPSRPPKQVIVARNVGFFPAVNESLLKPVESVKPLLQV
ncbi:hypothetical protein Lrub_0382 [Legionella rubrilucens]|uniref:Uncharacterized protein n=1 Tax=Legionella rubrilucens TaxID=458 RepID=A0A0W0XYW5_9GAMM|nr:hypothetical protein [Legionella rubrilucens]KTD49754.1 hypothetical protein Lrub_0382 [Legionella rubrilucens]